VTKRTYLVAVSAALFLAGGPALASPNQTASVPEAAALVLAPVGIAAVVAAERRRRRLADVKHGVGRAYFVAKRMVDLALSSAALAAFSPLVGIIALAIRLDSRGPVFFRRRVVGMDGRSFDMYKFRSMVDGAEQVLNDDEELRKLYFVNCKLDKDPRVTRTGKFMRATSLDELPQLLNIFLGHMTFVGPRPIAADEIDKYGPAFDRFKTVKPGITGIWQICGRSDLAYEKRVEMDMMYIDQRSILLDLWIIASTVPAVLLKRGAR
jgi:lipopolysaccharide/colanic/teichoic acid biosynthesis glycosyltransferase